MADERGQWGRQVEFILTLIGYAVGLGNVWRFPYLCYSNGGGAFLIPYVVCLIFLGIPVFGLEVSLGQFGGQGPITIWDINPAAKGIGMAAVTVSSIVMIYYGVVICWALRFLVASLTDHLPWEDCNSCQCVLYRQDVLDTNNETEIQLRNLSHINKYNETIPYIGDFVVNNSYGLNCSLNPDDTTFAKNRSFSDVFFNDRILGTTSGIDETGDLQWELLLCNLVAELIVFLVLVKGIKSLGKVVYFTAIFPYILLSILLIRMAMEDGAADGVRYYLEPDWDKLADAKVWSDAAVQIFFSLSACMGGLIAMSSYNNFNNNVIRDAFAVPIINCLTSFFAGFVVFCTLGHMAHLQNTSVKDVAKGGPGLVFMVYPEALTLMPISPLWSILFFFMISILGFSSQFSNAETVMTSLTDQFPKTFDTMWKRTLMRACICFIAFFLGIPIVTGSGQYLLDLIDGAVLGYPVLMVGLMECVVVVVLYGYNNFAEDIKVMVGRRPPIYLTACWLIITPVLLVAVIVFKAYQEEGKEVDWANLLYYLIIAFPIIIMPGWWFYLVCTKSELTKYRPAWRDRRQREEKSPEGANGDIELAEANGDVADNHAYDNKSYMHHKEEPPVRL